MNKSKIVMCIVLLVSLLTVGIAPSYLTTNARAAQVAGQECHFFTSIGKNICVDLDMPVPTETPTNTQVPTPTITFTPTLVPSPISTLTFTPTTIPTQTATKLPTVTKTVTPSFTPTSVVTTAVPSFTPTSLVSGIGSIALSYTQGGIWLTPSEIMEMPMNNASWDSLVTWSKKPMDIVNDITCTAGGACSGDSTTPNAMFARAVVGIRTNNSALINELKAELDLVDEAINKAYFIDKSTDDKWVERNIAQIAVSANLIDYRPQALLDSLHSVIYVYTFSGRTIREVGLKELPNRGSWGRWSYMATAYLLEDWDSIDAIVKAHSKAMGEKNWNGSPNTHRFVLTGSGSQDGWQTLQPGGKLDPIAIMPKGTYYLGHGVGGLWLADQYRAENGPTWIPTYTNYIYEGMSSYVAVAFAADHLGYKNVFALGDYALLRTLLFQLSAFDGKAMWPTTGNDIWIVAAIMTFARDTFATLPAEYKPEPDAVLTYPLVVSAGGTPGRGMGFMYATHYAR